MRIQTTLFLLTAFISTTVFAQEAADSHGAEVLDDVGFDFAAAMLDAERDPSWRVDDVDGETKVHLVNRDKDLRAYISDDGIWSLEHRTDEAAFRLDIALESFASSPTAELSDDFASLESAGVSQLWANTPKGIQHILVVDEPSGSEDELVLSLRVAGLTPAPLGPDGVRFSGSDDVEYVHYTGLYAFDANQRELDAWFEIAGDLIEIHANVADAAWPITADPLAATAITRNGPEVGQTSGFPLL